MDKKKPSTTVAKQHSARDFLLVVLPALVLTVAGFYVAYQFVEPAPPRHITMATGSSEGAYYHMGLRYQEILARQGIELELLETAGSFENLRLLQQPGGPVDVALIQGGAGLGSETHNVESLGSVFYEPIWIFWRGQAADKATALKNKSIAIGVEGSGTRQAMEYLLDANGIALDDIRAQALGGSAAAEALLGDKVDVAAFVSVYDTPYIEQLLQTENIQPMDFVRGSAYQRKMQFLSQVVLPRGFASLELDLPRKDVPLIAMVANLAARDDLHPALIALLLGAAVEIHGPAGTFSNIDQFPSVEHTSLPLNADAERYIRKGPPFLQRYLPFWLAIAIDRLVVLLIPLVTLLYPLFKLLPPTYRWRVRYRIFRYYRELLAVEARLHDNPDPQELADCRERVDDIKHKLDEVSVPVSYADTLYNLRLHLKLVQERLDEVSATQVS